ncbi:hypothetical protein CO038_02580 [Candidatus Pacearchaeota archaeon CG_4_9_14_0_2_um_filter_39_13]|nr:hypothetical protein [Candidatus Pacearchaeota archaeon]OIO44126.1 MAG: hypothetical protein AUJ64_00715 [Candidatus Pacearchaeota archaeon CG1_02_39_14]PJC44670.1 MAG: hypothetical protein CO038_02580 [Candidatus Pacearchaeota archaeon CG_4_9_14_0_2_um_filter_39_13]
MANETIVIENSSEFVGELVQALPNSIFGGIDFLINLAKIAGILVIIYLAFLIVRAFMRARAMKDIKTIKNHLAGIDKKMDKIVETLESKGKKKKS